MAHSISDKNMQFTYLDMEILICCLWIRQCVVLQSGEIICNVECNPLHGPRVEELIKKLEAGEELEKIAYVDEGIYAHGTDVAKVTVDGTDYEVTEVTQEVIDGRKY